MTSVMHYPLTIPMKNDDRNNINTLIFMFITINLKKSLFYILCNFLIHVSPNRVPKKRIFKVGSCPNNENLHQILFRHFLCSI